MTKRAKVDLLSWINKEVFAGVALGDSKQQVVGQLGVPPSWGGGDKDFIAANVWSYGIWTLFFEDGALDVINCAIFGLHSHEWYFEVELHEPFLSGNIDEMEKTFAHYNIPCIRFPGLRHNDNFAFAVRDVATGEIIECKRGPKVPMLVAGEKLRTSIIFNKGGDKARSIGSPFCLRTQELGYKKLDQKGSYVFVRSNSDLK
jgi:hypothetical protein